MAAKSHAEFLQLRQGKLGSSWACVMFTRFIFLGFGVLNLDCTLSGTATLAVLEIVIFCRARNKVMGHNGVIYRYRYIYRYIWRGRGSAMWHRFNCYIKLQLTLRPLQDTAYAMGGGTLVFSTDLDKQNLKDSIHVTGACNRSAQQIM